MATPPPWHLHTLLLHKYWSSHVWSSLFNYLSHRNSLNRFVTREKILQSRGGGGGEGRRNVLPPPQPHLPRMNTRPLAHPAGPSSMTHPHPSQQGPPDTHHVYDSHSHAKNLFPPDLNLNMNPVVPIPRLHNFPHATPTPDLNAPFVVPPPAKLEGR